MPQGARSFRIDNWYIMHVHGYWNHDPCFKLCMSKVCFIVSMEATCEYCLTFFFSWIAKKKRGFIEQNRIQRQSPTWKIFIRNEMVLFKSWVAGDESMINSWSLFSWVLDTFVSLHFKFLNRFLWREWI